MNSDAASETQFEESKSHFQLSKGVCIMKKPFLIVLILCTALLISACGASESPTNSTTAPASDPEITQNKLEISGEGFREWMDDFIEQRKWPQEPNKDPVAVVRSYIEKEKDAEYTISISFGKGEVDPEETRRVVAMYDGSELAASNCWSSAWIAEHFTVVYAEYDAAYDHEKTFLPDGARARHFYLIRDPDSMLWYIWDARSSTDR